jgi:hypothetical protein
MSRDVDTRARHALAALAEHAEHSPVYRRRDLLSQGISDALHVAMIRRGDLVRLRHGVFVVRELLEAADPVERHRIDVAAAIAGGREPVWAFSGSSTLLHGLPLPFAVPERIALARRSGADERALRRPSRHRLVIPNTHVTTGPIDPSSTLIVRGVPTVPVELAAVSTAAGLTSARWRTALFDGALWRGATVPQLEGLIELWRQLGHRAELLDALARARPGAQTVLETFSRLALMEGGVPEPILQQPFFDDEGLIGYADMWWPSLNVIGEADGLVKYASRADVIKEKRREDRMRAKGHPVVRWTFEDIEQHPERVIAAIWRASQLGAR